MGGSYEAEGPKARRSATSSPWQKWGAAARRGLAVLRQGRTTNAMLKHRGGVLTQYGVATPLCPAGYGGTGPFALLGLLDVTHGYVFGAPPCIWPRGASNAARPTCAEAP